MCNQRLQRLKNRFTLENVVEKYDKIFKEYEQNKNFEKLTFTSYPLKVNLPSKSYVTDI